MKILQARNHPPRLAFIAILWVLTLTSVVNAATAPPEVARQQRIYSLAEVLQLALERNPGVAAAVAQREAAEAGRITARAYPNPSVEINGGPSRGRQPGVVDGNAWAFAFSQPLEYPGLREARSRSATAGVDSAGAGFTALRINL